MIIGIIIGLIIGIIIGFVICGRKMMKDILEKLEELEGESPEEEMAIAKFSKMFYDMFAKGGKS